MSLRATNKCTPLQPYCCRCRANAAKHMMSRPVAPRPFACDSGDATDKLTPPEPCYCRCCVLWSEMMHRARRAVLSLDDLSLAAINLSTFKFLSRNSPAVSPDTVATGLWRGRPIAPITLASHARLRKRLGGTAVAEAFSVSSPPKAVLSLLSLSLSCGQDGIRNV